MKIKISKLRLRKIIKEELLKEDHVPMETIEDDQKVKEGEYDLTEIGKGVADSVVDWFEQEGIFVDEVLYQAIINASIQIDEVAEKTSDRLDEKEQERREQERQEASNPSNPKSMALRRLQAYKYDV